MKKQSIASEQARKDVAAKARRTLLCSALSPRFPRYSAGSAMDIDDDEAFLYGDAPAPAAAAGSSLPLEGFLTPISIATD